MKSASNEEECVEIPFQQKLYLSERVLNFDPPLHQYELTQITNITLIMVSYASKSICSWFHKWYRSKTKFVGR